MNENIEIILALSLQCQAFLLKQMDEQGLPAFESNTSEYLFTKKALDAMGITGPLSTLMEIHAPETAKEWALPYLECLDTLASKELQCGYETSSLTGVRLTEELVFTKYTK